MNLPSLPPASAGGDDILAGLLRLVAGARPDVDTQLIKKAYAVAARMHQGQNRMSGDPYITHPVAVAAILAEIGADDPTLCAALLHDVVADTPYTLGELESEFGSEVAGLVDGAMALDAAAREQQAAAGTGRAPAITAPDDERILVIKVADRLHNMRTLRHLPRAKQVEKSRQTLEVLVPAARALRLPAISSELEKLASAALAHGGGPPPTASGRLLAFAATVLPAPVRARWREEWLAELHVLRTRRSRITFAAQIVLGIGQLAVTLYRPAAALRRASSAVFAAAVTVSGLVVGGWTATAVIGAAALAVLATLIWVLHNDARTRRFTRLICALRGVPPPRRLRSLPPP
jgi:hypothetical protein